MKNHITGVGADISRVEGNLKVAGLAKYASEFSVPGKVYAQGLNSTIAKGKITSVDASEALAQPGVLRVITHQNAEQLATYDQEITPISNTTIRPVLQSPEVHYYGQYIGVVVAETLEQAQFAARLVKFEYATEEPAIDFEAQKGNSYEPSKSSSYSRGNLEEGLAAAEHRLEETYYTPIEHHHPMELHAAIANWKDDKLELYAGQQMVQNSVTTISKTFNIPKDSIHVITPYIGGGFGSKLATLRHVTLAIMASRAVNRPVQLTVTRTQMFTNTNLRQANEQRMRIGAKSDGTLTALSHDTLSHTSTYEQYQEQCGTVSKMLYATPNASVTHRLIPMNIQTPYAMRAPGEATGSFALESAMDELAWQLDMDPIELRIKNDTQTDPSNGKPFGSRMLVECLRIGADKFGWADRPMKPRSRTKGNWLIGYGVSGASRAALTLASAARVAVQLKGGETYATVSTDATEIGTGTYTILAQTASEYLNIPIERITVELGDSDYPVSPGSGGSWGAASFSDGVRQACVTLLDELRSKAGITDTEKEMSLEELLLEANVARYEVKDTGQPPRSASNYSNYSWGANFAEVWVDKDTGMYRIHRMLNVGAAGKIINPKTAYGQVIGGLVMGAGMVIAEQTKVEPEYGNFITRSFADYHVPVNLDMATMDVIFLPEQEEVVNKMGVKGIGELGITSVAASITNAIFNATGKRFRDLPVTPESVIKAGLEPGVV